jgi:D-alanine-D-alanine ligase
VPGGILFVYNAVADAKRHGYFTECLTFTQVGLIGEVLDKTGLKVVHLNLQSPEQLADVVRREGPFIIAFCLAEGFLDIPLSLVDGSGAGWVRRILDDLEVEATHCAAPTLDICRHKDQTHKILSRFNLPVPQHFTVRPGIDSLEKQLKIIEETMTMPLFVKPAGGGSSVGISDRSLVRTYKELASQVYTLLREFGDSPILVEKYLPGREYTVGIMGNKDKLVLPIIAFPLDEKVRTLESKRMGDEDRVGQEIIAIGDPRYYRMSKLVVDAFEAIGARDVLRIDIREDSEGNPVIIDVNALPTMTPSASMAQMALWAGFSYDYFIELFLNIALERVHGHADVADVARLKLRKKRGLSRDMTLKESSSVESATNDRDI